MEYICLKNISGTTEGQREPGSESFCNLDFVDKKQPDCQHSLTNAHLQERLFWRKKNVWLYVTSDG